jgi:DNA (cytosine-5)-methyltransferase 1
MKVNGKRSFESDERHYLYRHYLRILALHKPTFFILENVKGLLSSKVKGKLIFEEILKDLHNPGRILQSENPKYRIFPLVNYNDSKNVLLNYYYKPEDFLVQCEKHGIPQRRHRIIILGVLDSFVINEIPIIPEKPSCNSYDVLSDIVPIRSKVSRKKDSLNEWKNSLISEFGKLNERDFPKDVYDAMDAMIDIIQCRHLKTGSNFVLGNPNLKMMSDWYLDHNLNGFCNHEAKAHMSLDLLRYLFVACYGKVKKISPKLRHFPDMLLPKHNNVHKSIESRHSFFADRFRVQLRNEPSTTITSHISKDGHFYIHYDPKQCRSLTVREAARLQTFPDNYFFEGPRTEQYLQVGNAVPPLLAYEIANIIKILITSGAQVGRQVV